MTPALMAVALVVVGTLGMVGLLVNRLATALGPTSEMRTLVEDLHHHIGDLTRNGET